MHVIGGIWRTKTLLGPGPKSVEAERLKGSGVETKTGSLEYDGNMLQNFHKSLQSVKRINVTSVCHGERERKMMMHDDLAFLRPRARKRPNTSAVVHRVKRSGMLSTQPSRSGGAVASRGHVLWLRRERFVCRSQASRNKRIELAGQGRFLECNWQT